MRVASVLALGASAIILGSCGGGDSSGPPTGGPAPTPTPTPPPTLSVTLSKSSDTIVLQEGETASFGFDASYTGTSPQPIVADVAIGGERYALKGSPTANGTSFTLEFETLPLAAGGEKTSTITFRLCTSANCSTVYPGSTQTFQLTLDVQLEDWGMFQRNAAHTGYVAAHYDPADFADAWTWNLTSGATLELSSTRGKVFVTQRNFHGQSDVHALSVEDGSKLWTRSLGDQAYTSGPSFSDGKIFVTSMQNSSENNPLWILDGDTGSVLQQAVFASQWNDFAQPTVFGESVFVAAGYFGNVVYNFDNTDGSKIWEENGSGGTLTDGRNVAADENYVYYYPGNAMDVFDRLTGQLVKSVPDPDFNSTGFSLEAAPVLDGNDRVFGFSSAKLSGYSVTSGTKIWLTDARYATAPAYAHERLFAARQDLQLIDAIDPATGAVDFSLTFPGSDSARSNLVIADNLLFVSGAGKTYAFDLSQSGYPVIWETDVSGRYLAISPDNLLLISDSNRVRAVSLAP